MSTKTNDRYPVLLKSIPLPADERERLRRVFTINERLKDQIIDLMIAAQTKLQDREQAIFNEVAQRFGFSGTADAHAEGKVVEISWATSQLNLRSDGREETTTEQKG